MRGYGALSPAARQELLDIIETLSTALRPLLKACENRQNDVFGVRGMTATGLLQQDGALRQRVIRYVLDRKCLAGGFCFYKLEEPNGSDTWHALSILDLLGAPFEDEATVAYLKGMQRPDGSYDSIYAAYFSIRSLALLGEAPFADPRPYILRNLEHYRFDVGRLPAEVISMFKRTSYLVELYGLLQMDTDGTLRDNIVDFILGFQNEDGGFGHLFSTLLDTARALAMLKSLGRPVEGLGAETFIRLCEVPFYGLPTSLTRPCPSGVCIRRRPGLVSDLATADLPRQCETYILNCQNRMGGFSRTMQGGSPRWKTPGRASMH
jgi:hypothetical protein